MKAKHWLFSALLLVSAFAQAQEKFKVGYIRVMDDAQAMVAHEAGLYAKHGLDVELIEFSSGTDLIKAIVGGQLDTGVLGFTNAVAWASKGADLKVVGGAQQGYHSILVREQTGIADVAGLKGHSLASQREGSTADAVLRGVTLKAAGLKPSDVNIMGVSPAVAVQSLVSGRVDAAFLFEPYDRIAQLVAPVKQVYEIGEVWPFPCMVVITSGDTLAKRKDAVWKSLDAQRDAISLLEQQPAEAAKLIADYFIAEPTLKTLKRGELPRETVIEEAIATQTFSAKLDDQDLARIQELADILQEQGSLKTRDGKAFDTRAILDLSWQAARQL
ncbi:ABC transporter substrate-binding protein [Pseudomonas stutzeri]|jgi:NitT/TauT family transport system substrate-binding protein|uniref:ABC transporter substrate-binding protein n=1 Tax=Pseudomonas TaxID=286 RepID=UPI00051D017E|nr:MULTISPECIES: ABC transporter substrate-binding protein [Pseudomonas]KGK84900.1 ABC transporter substrate-binding protein [Stutzerimonas degradans]MDT3710042.1 ABC transporter substrate-binding protein [Pseudomonadaceae bacterium]MCQ4232569.1 ABC transporter substrate-binding protein [Stutzerimonas degradans]MCQ4268334.1 ABC transporter substrate-binding protein [Stutzerimonas degradans]OOE09660.1 ABC transporter substrate-binding protein [Stutzerimonas degradans]